MKTFAAFLLACFAAAAQAPQVDASGTISGKITDQSGAMVPNALIQLKNLDTREVRETHPYIGGLYRFREVKPGTYEVYVKADGFTPATLARVEVKASEVTRADASLQLTNVNAEITVAAGDGGRKSATRSLLEAVPVVEAATLRLQTLEEAPANVSVISSTDIKRYGYRTLGEALSSARGFYFINDRIYQYGGVRGLNIPGDYNSRFLVMINGHAMTDNIYNSNGFFGQDFGLDMDLVERIEIVRGPSSTLYGTNGMLANINIVTKLPVDQQKLKVSTENSSFNMKKMHFSTAQTLGKSATLLLSGSVFHGGGRDLSFDVYNTPGNNFGRTRSAQLERGYHSFADLSWKDWRFTGYFNNRENQPPVGWGDSLFDTGGNRVNDGRNFAEAAYTHTFKSGSTVRWRTSYDSYRYYDRFYFQHEDHGGHIEDSRTYNLGDWMTSQLSYSFAVKKIGELTVGTQGRFELRAKQEFVNLIDSEDSLTFNNPDRAVGVFAQQEIVFSKRLKGYVGVRFDQSRNFDNYLSPQAALVYEHSPRTIYKAVYGRPFRNPSSFEQYYGDGGSQYLASGGLRQETAQVFEGSVERKVTTKWSILFNGYQYQLNNLIRAVPVGTAQQYQNTAGSARSQGAEAEVTGRPRPWMQIAGSYGFGRAKDIMEQLWLPNSPRHIAKARFVMPLWRDRMQFSTATQYMSARVDRDAIPTRQVVLTDFTVNTSKLHPHFDLMMGVRNAMGYRYEDPIATYLPRMRQDGRTFFLKVIYHSDAN